MYLLRITALFLPHLLLVHTSMDAENWAEWLHYMQASSNQSFSDSKTPSPHSTFIFTEDFCQQPTTTNSTNNNNTSVDWHRISVASDGSKEFVGLQEAIDAIPKHNQLPTLICIAPGTYREKIIIPRTKDYITLIGKRSDNDAVIVVWNDTASTINPDTHLPLKTFNTTTIAINAKYFTAKNIVFENDAPPPKQGEIGGQAVALRITGDSAAFYNCKFLGHQDTLYDQKGRHYFKDCFIQGTVDFIFGNGRSLYKNCHIHALPVGYPSVGSVTAQKRASPNFNSGFTFLECNLTGDGSVYLGRAWGPDSRVVYAYTWMDKIVAPQGWNDWGIASRERTVFYAEYQCYGPGSNTSMRVPWARQLTAQEAQPFLSVGFINGNSWLQEV